MNENQEKRRHATVKRLHITRTTAQSAERMAFGKERERVRSVLNDTRCGV